MLSSGRRESLWMKSGRLETPPRIWQETTADVCVVGAGIAGLTTALLLAEAGRSVVVLDDGPIADGETGRTTAHLSSALDDRYHRLATIRGREAARLAADSHSAAIDFIDQTVRRERIACDFERVDGYLFLGPGHEREKLETELDAARDAGLSGVELLPRAPAPSFDTGPCLRFPRQGQFHVLKYLDRVAAALRRHGGHIFGGAHAEEIEAGRVRVRGGPDVHARAIVVATNTPVNDRVTMHTKQAPYRTYAIAALIPDEHVAPALYWDTLDPYHYVRFQPHEAGFVVVSGGEDHKTGQADDGEERFRRLVEWTRARFPDMGEVVARWSGQVLETMDGLAYIGRNPGAEDGVFIATGDSGMGMTHGTIAGLLLTDLILGRANPWAELYDPSRKPLGGAMEFLRENANVAVQYADWLAPGEVKSADDVPPGEGAVLRSGLSRIAVHRRTDGTLVRRNARCPHLGCSVAWNSAEGTWDCPCHGSRFDGEGRVLNGPANRDLSPAEE